MTDLERELLYRLLDINYGAGTVKQKLYVGELPPDFPVALPEGSRVLGGQEQTFPKRPASTQGLSFQLSDHSRVLMDSALPVSAFIAQMRSQLTSEWEDADWPMMPHTGFLPTEAQDALSMYSPALEKMLNVRAAEVSGVTQVTLDLNNQSRQEREQTRRHFDLHHQQLLVPVRVPAGATVQPGGGGSSDNHASSDAFIESGLSADELLKYFGVQLLENNWQSLTHAQIGAVTAASWTNRQGGLVFISLETAEQGHSATMIATQSPGSASERTSSYAIRS